MLTSSLIDLPATAVIRVGSSGSTSTLRTAKSQPLELQVGDSGKVGITLAMLGASGGAFSVEGPASVGAPVANDHVVIFLPTGELIDTVQGNPCTASYATLSDTKVDATFTCLTREGADKVKVTVRLTTA